MYMSGSVGLWPFRGPRYPKCGGSNWLSPDCGRTRHNVEAGVHSPSEHGTVIDPSGITLDDDTPLQVSNLGVNEASPWAVFTVLGKSNQPITLQLATTGTGTGHATNGVDFNPVARPLQYFDASANA